MAWTYVWMCTYYCVCVTLRVYVFMFAGWCQHKHTVCEGLWVCVFVCTGVKLTWPGSLLMRAIGTYSLWTRGEDAWSSCLHWAHAAVSPSLTSVLHRLTNPVNNRTSWKTMSVPVLLYILSVLCGCITYTHTQYMWHFYLIIKKIKFFKFKCSPRQRENNSLKMWKHA